MTRLHIAVVIPGMPCDGHTLTSEKSLGGSETAGISMAEALRDRGHKVTVYCNTQKPPELFKDIEYINIVEYPQKIAHAPYDVLIVQRAPEALLPHNSKLLYLWCHDLALKRHRGNVHQKLWMVDGLFVLSDFMKKQYHDLYGIPESHLLKTRNGIDLSLFPRPNGRERRDPNLLVFTGRPERGMEILVFKIFPEILKRRPQTKLYMTGYDNFVTDYQPLYTAINEQIARLGGAVAWGPPHSKRKLYDLYNLASGYIYPSNFEEISCITAMECMAMGLPFVGSQRAALPETLAPGAGDLIDGDATTDDYCQKFVSSALSLLDNADTWRSRHDAGLAAARELAWSGVAGQWEGIFLTEFERRTQDKVRLARHHLWRGNAIPAVRALEKATGQEPFYKETKEWMDKDFSFVTDGTYKDNRNKMTEIVTDPMMAEVKMSPRYISLLQWLKAHPDVKNLLDFGCCYGNHALNLIDDIPGLKVTGIDYDEQDQAIFEKYRQKSPNKDNATFILGNEDVLLTEKYDAVYLGEVLEHCPEPWTILDKVEKWVVPGGYVLMTTPLGPWEAASFKVFPYPIRQHVWEIETEDFDRMLEKKKNVQTAIIPYAFSPADQSPIGWMFVTYQTNGKPCKMFDMDRKQTIQNPKSTLSVCMIVKNSENQFLRTLKSVEKIADEIIIVDTGSTDDTITQATRYTEKIFKGSDPQVTGFEVPRNESIEKAQGDWIMWIDSDEELCNWINVPRYLKPNIYNGYAIAQHHFSVEPPSAFPPDLPVRLFRNRQGIKFYGQIHEHPESEFNKGVERVVVIGDVHIAHDGYFTEAQRRNKFLRNIPLMMRDREKYPERILGKFLMMRDHVHLARYEMEQTGGRMTPSVNDHAHKAIGLFRSAFLSNGMGYNHMVVDGLQYYSEACKLANIGLDVMLALDLHPHHANLTPPNVRGGTTINYRFASTEDVEAFFKKLLTAKEEPWVGNYI